MTGLRGRPLFGSTVRGRGFPKRSLLTVEPAKLASETLVRRSDWALPASDAVSRIGESGREVGFRRTELDRKLCNIGEV